MESVKTALDSLGAAYNVKSENVIQSGVILHNQTHTILFGIHPEGHILEIDILPPTEVPEQKTATFQELAARITVSTDLGTIKFDANKRVVWWYHSVRTDSLNATVLRNALDGLIDCARLFYPAFGNNAYRKLLLEQKAWSIFVPFGYVTARSTKDRPITSEHVSARCTIEPAQ